MCFCCIRPTSKIASDTYAVFFAHCDLIFHFTVRNKVVCTFLWLRTTDKWMREEYVLFSVSDRLTSVSLPQTVHLVLRPDLGGFCLFSYAPRQPVLQNSWKDSLESTWATMVPFMFVMSLKKHIDITDWLTSTENVPLLVIRTIDVLVFVYFVHDLQIHKIKSI